ncbi:MAG TPA: hypothetical protein VJH23_02330 [archaeon]|nr:hypothetical protein [archaeon]
MAKPQLSEAEVNRMERELESLKRKFDAARGYKRGAKFSRAESNKMQKLGEVLSGYYMAHRVWENVAQWNYAMHKADPLGGTFYLEEPKLLEKLRARQPELFKSQRPKTTPRPLRRLRRP